MKLPFCCLLMLSLTLSHAQTLQKVQGQAEVQGSSGGWQGLDQAGLLNAPVRTLLGRLELQSQGGTVLLGSNTLANPKQGEVQITAGQAYLQGQLPFFVGLAHAYLQGRARADLGEFGSTISVLEGTLRLSIPQVGVVNVPAGQRYVFKTRQLQPFEEHDPWYLNTWLGLGTVQATALRGQLDWQHAGSWQKLLVKSTLQAGDTVRSGAKSWAEFTFQDGSYFRLNEQSELQVLGIEKLQGGKRQITLKLNRGTAWNVVQKGNGGYQLRTATLVAGVRGTTFRLDATDTLKLFEGEVALDSETTALSLAAGNQYAPENGVQALQLDATDTFNQQLDTLRQEPLTVVLQPAPSKMVQQFTVQGATTSGAAVQMEWDGQVLPLEVQEDGQFAVPLNLPDGTHSYTVRAMRNNSEFALAQTVTLDHTPPQVTRLQASRTGHILTLDLQVKDQGPVQVQVLQQVVFYDGSLLHIPLQNDLHTLNLRLQDEAGNTTEQTVDVPAP